MRRYFAYRSEHFTVKESKELSHLRRLDYTELKMMVRERHELWRQFEGGAKNTGWGVRRRNIEWRLMVDTWYARRGYRGKEEVRIGKWRFIDDKDVWFWFNDIRDRIPEEKQYGRTPKHHKAMSSRERVSKAKHESVKARQDAVVAGLMRTVVKQPNRDKALTATAQDYGFKGQSLLKAAKRRGYI
jgi:hypothetical protein